MEINIVGVIQAMLAPAIMVSACGLLLLSINNKYSMVVNRIRVLDEEIRRYKHTQLTNGKLGVDEEDRLKSIITQIGKLSFRVRVVKNAVVCYSTAVAFFILTCLVIGLEYALHMEIYYLIVITFLTGMFCVLLGIIFSAKEAMKGHEIITIEINDTLRNTNIK